MFCGKCGSPIPDGAAFCGQCDAPVARQEVNAQPVQPAYHSTLPNPPTSPQAPNYYPQNPPQQTTQPRAQNLDRPNRAVRTFANYIGCITFLMTMAVAVAGAYGAVLTFKRGLPAVGIPVILLSVVIFFVWLAFWIAMVRSAR
jgi:zinc ribbon protein